MRLYRRFIRPVHCYPGQGYEPKTEPVEKIEIWYPEEEREHLEEKYGYLNEGHFSNLIFEEKYEPCLLKEQEPKAIEYHDNPFTGLPVALCPNCMRYARQFLSSIEEETHYCPWCGQAVKWE